MSKVLSKEIAKILDAYGKEVDDALKRASVTTADEIKETLRATSPKKTGRYAKGWEVTSRAGPLGGKIWIIHNPSRYRLTHLLERGHALKGGGRTRAFPHIKKAENQAKRNLVRNLKRELE
jgi:hypothetical protein